MKVFNRVVVFFCTVFFCNLLAQKTDGLENTNISEDKIGVQGNWVKKKEWLKDSDKINQEIQTVVESIQSFSQKYSQEYLPIDALLDEFYKKEGFNQASINALFVSVNNYLQKQKKKYLEQSDRGVISIEEVSLDELLDDNKKLIKSIEQLKLDIKSINDLDKGINDRLKKVEDFVLMANEESIKSSNMVDEIWNIIDDKKARLIFYKLKGENLEKVNAIKKYITETLYNDFNNYLDNIKKQMELVSNQIKELEASGIIIRERAERIQKIKEENLLKNQEQQEKISKKPEAKFWYQKLYYVFVDVLAKIYNFFN